MGFEEGNEEVGNGHREQDRCHHGQNSGSNGSTFEGLAVRCCTLDEATEIATPPDLIKVDAEGAEVDVLRGGLNFLATARPSLIVEFSNGTFLAEARDLLSFYTFKRLSPHHWLLSSGGNS